MNQVPICISGGIQSTTGISVQKSDCREYHAGFHGNRTRFGQNPSRSPACVRRIMTDDFAKLNHCLQQIAIFADNLHILRPVILAPIVSPSCNIF